MRVRTAAIFAAGVVALGVAAAHTASADNRWRGDRHGYRHGEMQTSAGNWQRHGRRGHHGHAMGG